ncbi:MAG TPA: hypothetical protein PK514_07020 [Spirochaetota bacterium]|nr:hypothetical protein [Spirochaetota bacterium]
MPAVTRGSDPSDNFALFNSCSFLNFLEFLKYNGFYTKNLDASYQFSVLSLYEKNESHSRRSDYNCSSGCGT